jgi:colicin import membrane protein
MAGFLRQHASALVLSALLHIVILTVLGVTFRFQPRRVPVVPLAIEATLIDESAMRQETERQQAEAQARIDAREAAERQAREQADQARREAAAEAQRQQQLRQDQARQQREAEAAAEKARQQQAEQQREARLQAERDAREKAEREAAAKAQREAEAKAKAEREAREAAERKAAAERERRAAEEAARQQALERELRMAMAEEEERQAAEDAGLLDQYVRLIEDRIERNWIRPASAVAGLECVVKVSQIPSGDVVSVRFGRCNGDDAVMRSIEAAVLRASPLPKPPNPRLFDRNLEVTFRPDS